MKKIIRLTERDLTRLVKRIVRESEDEIDMDIDDDSRVNGFRRQHDMDMGDDSRVNGFRRQHDMDIDDSVGNEDDYFKGYRDQIISYLNDNGIYPKSDDDIRDGLSDLYYQRDTQAIRFVRRLSNHNR